MKRPGPLPIKTQLKLYFCCWVALAFGLLVTFAYDHASEPEQASARPVLLQPVSQPTEEPDMEPLPVSRIEVSDHLMYGIRMAESGGNPNAVSRKGAIGECQIMPDTARWLGANPHAKKNCPTARRYVTRLANQFDSEFYGVAAFNAGPGFVEEWVKKGAKLERLPKETQDYLLRVYVFAEKSKHMSKLGEGRKVASR